MSDDRESKAVFICNADESVFSVLGGGHSVSCFEHLIEIMQIGKTDLKRDLFNLSGWIIQQMAGHLQTYVISKFQKSLRQMSLNQSADVGRFVTKMRCGLSQCYCSILFLNIAHNGQWIAGAWIDVVCLLYVDTQNLCEMEHRKRRLPTGG